MNDWIVALQQNAPVLVAGAWAYWKLRGKQSANFLHIIERLAIIETTLGLRKKNRK